MPSELSPDAPTGTPAPAPAPARGRRLLLERRRHRREGGLRVAVFTTSYPRGPEDFAGRFVAGVVEHVREAGCEVEVVGPGSFRDFGLTAATGAGLVGNLRRRPWVAPLAFASMAWSLRRAARSADLVHANWLAGALVARFSGRPFVVTLHGSGTAGRFDDLGLARRLPRLVRWALRPARAVICCSETLATAIRGCGVENVHAVPYGIDLPDEVAAPDGPPLVLFVGRLSEEKGVDVLAEATAGLPLVALGDGPLRHLLPPASALGAQPPEVVRSWYGRATAVVLASRSEGLPNVLIEAMAHGRPVVATAVGGIPDLVDNGRNGFLFPPGAPAALRAALERLLGDRELCARLGRAGRAKIEATSAWPLVTRRIVELYAGALRRDGLPAAAAAAEPAAGRSVRAA